MNSGGLIEANHRLAGETMRAWFPPVNSGGLIEADLVTRPVLLGDTAFPPVNSGGLIEAGTSREKEARASAGFRR